MSRRGVVMIEVLVAIAILSLVGVSMVTFTSSVVQSEERRRSREQELLRAERLLIATLLLTQSELEQRIGVRYAGDFAIWIDRPEPYLFRVAIATAARPTVEILATLVHRRDEISQNES